nr:FAD-dependent monooxygenase [uncultured Dyadobacter sp.]
MEVAIIGAGIGGLATALALKTAQIPFRIYEGAPALAPVGAGIMIANNAMQAFRTWGIAGQIAAAGNRISVMNLTRPDLRPISSINLGWFEQRSGLHNIGIHRADLHNILVNAVGMDRIVLNKKLRTISQGGATCQLSFEDDTKVEAAYVMGADGLRSRVRGVLFDNCELRNAQQNCWRGVTDFHLADQYHHELNEAWGKGKRFGFVRLNERQVYWYLLIDHDLAATSSDVYAHLDDFHPLVTEIIQATPASGWIAAPIFDLKPMEQWSDGRVCLIGDAAHATTPNLGQGACQAIEDAYVLGELLKTLTLDEAIRRYPSVRMSKAHYVVETSWRIGKMAHLRSPLMIGLRNLMMRATPQRINRKSLERILTLRYPGI